LNGYRAPRWLPGGQLQTIWPALFARRARPRWRRQRWDTPDGDFIDVDRIDAAAADAPLLVLFHGLEGSSRSHYAAALAQACGDAGWSLALPHFRGCSGELNRAPRAYHSGDWAEIDWMLRRLRAAQRGPMFAAGVSLGGNALLRWAQEAGAQAACTVGAVAAVSAPLDLAAGAAAIGRGFNRLVYTRMFLRTLKPKAIALARRHPGLADVARIAAARDLHAFDDAFTAPVHGFADAVDYWRRSSAGPRLGEIRLPALVLNARNDPFLPARALPTRAASAVTLEQPMHGGHVGFAHGAPPGRIDWMPQRLLAFFADSG
jgi:predicted alpha/beta-fold hydrolase